jgi:hypothetical protein
MPTYSGVYVGTWFRSGRQARRCKAAGFAIGLLCLCASGCARSSQGAPSGPLTTVEQVRQLTPKQVAAQVPVRLHGTVTYFDALFQMLLVQDATGAVRVEGEPPASLGPDQGASVDLQGTVASGGSNPEVTFGSIRVGDKHSPLPAPVRPSAEDLASGRLQYQRAEIEGVVRSAFMGHDNRFYMVVRTLGRDVWVRVKDQSAFTNQSPVDARVRVRGDLFTSLDVRGVAVGVKLWATAIEDVQILMAAPAAADVPVGDVRSVLTTESARLPDHRIRLHGTVSFEKGKLMLRDSTGVAPLQTARSESVEAGRALDFLCFAGEEGGARVLSFCTVWDGVRERRDTGPLPVLATIGRVKELSEAQASLGYPVHLQAVVTYHNPEAKNTFVQDRTGGIFVYFPNDPQPVLHLGDLVEIDGFAAPGQFAPVVSANSARVIDRQALPEPLRIDMEQLHAGIADSTWVEADGVVHAVNWEGGHPVLGLNWGIHQFTAYVYGSTKPPQSLLDARVHIRGVCGARFNYKRQILGVQLFVPDASFIRVEGNGAPHSPPLRDIEQLLQFTSASHFGERSRIRGVVTLTERTGPTYVSDPTGGVLIQNHAPVDLKVGDSVEAIGLPVAVPGLFNPVLRDAEIRQLGHTGGPVPTLLTATDILDDGYDAQLVQLDAELVDQAASGSNQALVLQAGNRLFEARIDGQRLPSLEKGSLLRVTGITSIQTQESQQTMLPQAFSVLLRSPADIVVIQSAPWWTAARTFRVLGLVCAVAALALAWIVVLRRRVQLQTADLRGTKLQLRLSGAG